MDFKVVYEQHVDYVYGYHVYRSRSMQVAEDLTRETFERALRGWETYDPESGPVRTWLLAIARSAYISSRRSERSRPPVGSEVQGAFGIAPELAAALRRLERPEREVIALRFGGDLLNAEIAAALGISAANARQVLSRALRHLGAILDG